MKRSLALLVLLAVLTLSGCGGKSAGTALIVVDVPLSSDAYIGQTIVNGVRLAASHLGVQTGDFVNFRVVSYDNAGSPARAVADIRQAVTQHAAAIVTDGTGVSAGWRIAAAAHIPIGIVYDGDASLVDAQTRPNVFRIVPTDNDMASRLAEYLAPKRLKIAFLTSDTEYGRGGLFSLDRAYAENPRSVVARITIPASATDLAPQVLQARRSGATALIVWGEPGVIAEAVIAARSAGWQVPFFAPPAAEDPLVRQELASRPQWLNGLTFVDSRLTSEEGPAPYYSFQSSYQSSFGPERVGVKGPGGCKVIQPPEFAMYASDFVNLLAAAIDSVRTTNAAQVLAALNQVSIEAANGDSRGLDQVYHEGVYEGDIYFAQFDDMVFSPVLDDPLSRTLPAIDQCQ